MEKLDLTTSHNIVVTVELADVSQRIMATILDTMIVGFYCTLMFAISFGVSEISTILILPVLLCYHLLMEYFNDGQSLGKKALKIKVISLTGERPELLALVMRWMFRLLDLGASIGMIALIFSSSTKKKQRIGDILADTAVVKVENERFISLKSILTLSDENYKPAYPLVTNYNDTDMLLVKEALMRYQKKPTDSNSRLISELCKKITKDFKIKIPVEQRLDFLRKVLNDYIILTR